MKFKKKQEAVFTKWRSSHCVTKWQIYTTGILCAANCANVRRKARTFCMFHTE